MVKTATAKPKSKPSAKPTRKRQSSPTSGDGNADQSRLTPPPVSLNKAFVLQLVIAKLEASKTCDWFAVAQKLGGGGNEQDLPLAKGGKRGKASKTEKMEKGMDRDWTGTELHDLYHNTILPALKSGRALWVDTPDSTSTSPPLVGTPSDTDNHREPEVFFDADDDMGEAAVLEKVVPAKLVKASKKPISASTAGSGPTGDDSDEDMPAGELLEEVVPVTVSKKPASTAAKKSRAKKDNAKPTSYRQAVLGKAGAAGKKTTRPAYETDGHASGGSGRRSDVSTERPAWEDDDAVYGSELESEEGEAEATNAILD